MCVCVCVGGGRCCVDRCVGACACVVELVLRHVWVRQRPVVSLIALWVCTFLVVHQSADDE